jgi:glycosyltransferase involved in cell wall biosynthesis
MLDHLRRTRFPKERIVVLLNQRGELRDVLRKEGIRSELVRWKGGGTYLGRQLRWYGAMLRAARLLRQLNPAVVVCNTFPDLDTTGRVAARLGFPIVWRARADTFTQTHDWPADRRKEVVRFLNESVTRIVPTTSYETRLMLEAGVDRRKINVVHNGVDLKRYDDRAAGKRLREELHISQNEYVIAFVARMIQQKGYEVFFGALAGLKLAGYAFRALVAGDVTLLEDRPQEYKAGLHRMVCELNLGERVVFLGQRKDVPAVMNAADLFVLSSLKEPFGTTAVEAMAAALPVVASDLPGPRESMLNEETGIFFPAGDIQALQRAIVRLIESPEMGRRMGELGRRRAEARFDLRAYVSSMDEECRIAATMPG